MMVLEFRFSGYLLPNGVSFLKHFLVLEKLILVRDGQGMRYLLSECNTIVY
jgi:hypothetical protein